MELSGAFPTVDDVDGLVGADLDRALATLERARRQVEAAYIAVLDSADRARHDAADGHASVRGWASALGNVAGDENHRRLQTMRALRDLPAVRAALADGSLGVDQVREIAKLHANPRARDVIVDAEDQLLDHAVRRPFDAFAEVVGRWRTFADPSGAAGRAHEARRADVFERGGVTYLRAQCGAAQGAAIKELLEGQSDAEFLADWKRMNHESAYGPDGLHAVRTSPQRWMDALHALLLRGASTPGGSEREPVVNLVMTETEHEAHLAAAAGGDRPPPATADDIDRRRHRPPAVPDRRRHPDGSGRRRRRRARGTRPPGRRRRSRSGDRPRPQATAVLRLGSRRSDADRATMSVARLRAHVTTEPGRPHHSAP